MFTLGVLASGKGTNLKAIMEVIRNERLPIKIGAVITDTPGSGAFEIAKRANCPGYCLPCTAHKTFLDPSTEKEYVKLLKNHGVHLVCLAGFMRVIKTPFFKGFPGHRIINIHPSLLPAFPGLAAWEQALQHGVCFTGCTAHFVEEGVDTGPIIMQAVVPVLGSDKPDTLHRRIQEKEHFIYPLAVKLISEGRVSVSGRKVNII